MAELFCIGFGYSARELARRLLARGWRVAGTVRSEERAEALRAHGFDALVFAGETPSPGVAERIAAATHLLISAPPTEAGDPALAQFQAEIATAPRLEWIGYLSTVGVYGDHGGAWVDETASLNATQERSRRRVAAEQAWLEFGERSGKAVHVFRLAGIYGPGRSAIDNLKEGRARRVVKEGQVFNRVHVDDIATALEASIRRPNPGAVYNVADDEPAPPQDLVTYGAELLDMDPPPAQPFEQAELTEMARSFYGENKRVSNKKLKRELGVELRYPTYREGLKAVARSRARTKPED